MDPILRILASAAVEMPDDWMAMTMAMGAVPVAIVSMAARSTGLPLSRSTKSSTSSPSTSLPFVSVTVTGTCTRRDCAPKRVSGVLGEGGADEDERHQRGDHCHMTAG